MTPKHPTLVTKNLAVNRNIRGSRVRLFSNFLDGLGFPIDTKIRKERLPAGGFKIIPDMFGEQTVHRRRYLNPSVIRPFRTELYVEFTDSSFLSGAIGSSADRIHVTMRPGELVFRPVAPLAFNILKRLNRDGAHSPA